MSVLKHIVFPENYIYSVSGKRGIKLNISHIQPYAYKTVMKLKGIRFYLVDPELNEELIIEAIVFLAPQH